MLMDVRRAPAEHYDKAVEILERAVERGEPVQSYLEAIAHALLGLLRHQMNQTR